MRGFGVETIYLSKTSFPSSALGFAGKVEDLKARKVIQQSNTALQRRQVLIQQEQEASLKRLEALKSNLIILSDGTRLTGLDFLTLVAELQRKSNRSLSKNLKRSVLGVASTALAATGVGLLIMLALKEKGVYHNAFMAAPKEHEIADLLDLSDSNPALVSALQKLEKNQLLRHVSLTHSPETINSRKPPHQWVGPRQVVVNRWQLTPLGKQVLKQWQAKQILDPADVTRSP